MTTYTEKRNLPYTPEQLFSLVADVERYPDFLPWCKKCTITSTNEEQGIFYADLFVGYKMIREKFGSKVTLSSPDYVLVEYASGPMKHLSNHWKFLREEDSSCTIDFFVEFEFKNKLLQSLMGIFFDEIVQRMVKAFEERAQKLYGSNSFNQEIKSFATS
jgi:coenzyme Q-binding protein COQ10